MAARKVGLAQEALDARFERVGEVPFSSERKMMSTVHEDAKKPERRILFVKGAPDVLLPRCSHEVAGDEARLLTAQRRTEIRAAAEARGRGAQDPRRRLPVAPARDPYEAGRQRRARVGLHRRSRHDRPSARRGEGGGSLGQGAGIRPMMITGDHPGRRRPCEELNITEEDRAITGAELERLDDETLERTVRECSVYARVNPEHKLRIVRALQNNGQIVAMTGDGVNDAPALKTADIGVAMGITGTDVSKEAADMVLTDDNFASIVAAVEEGRSIFANIQKFLRYLLSSNIGEVLTVFLGVILASVIGLTAGDEGALVLPLLATQILWINLITDGAPALALGLDPADPDVMRRPPRPAASGVITRRMSFGIAFVGTIMAVAPCSCSTSACPAASFKVTATPPTRGRWPSPRWSCSSSSTPSMPARRAQRVSQVVPQSVATGCDPLVARAADTVVYAPFLQPAFGTVALRSRTGFVCIAVASSVLWLREVSKLFVSRDIRQVGAAQLHSGPGGLYDPGHTKRVRYNMSGEYPTILRAGIQRRAPRA